VDWVLEIKPDISNKNEIVRALKQCISVKKLRRIKGPFLVPQNKPPHVVDVSRQIPFFLFTQKSKANYLDTVYEIIAWYKEKSVPKEEQLDAIAVQGFGIINNIKHRDFYYYGWSIPEGEKEGWFFESWESKSGDTKSG